MANARNTDGSDVDVYTIPMSDREIQRGWRARPRDQGPAPAPYWMIARLAAWSILLIAISAAGAYTIAARGKVVYAARSEVVFDLRDFGYDASERFLRTQVVVAGSRAVLSPIATQFDMPIGDVEESLSVDTVDGSGVIRLQFAHSNKAVALDVLRALTVRYLAEISTFDRTAPILRWVLTEPFVLADPISPQPLRAAAFGAIAGVLLAAGMILLWTLIWPAR